MSRPRDPDMCPVCRTRHCQKRRHQTDKSKPLPPSDKET